MVLVLCVALVMFGVVYEWCVVVCRVSCVVGVGVGCVLVFLVMKFLGFVVGFMFRRAAATTATDHTCT